MNPQRVRPPKAKSLFYEKTLLLFPARLFFNPSIRTFGIVFFFSQGPPRTLLPDTTPKIPFPYRKIDHFMIENPPALAFHQEFSENHQKSARDG